MRISKINNNYTNNVTFSGDSLHEKAKEAKKALKDSLRKKESVEIVKKHLENIDAIENKAKGLLTTKDKHIPKFFTWIVKMLGKVKVDKTGNKALDSASRLTNIVLWGNVGKEAVGTTLYTVQALTNQDLPPDKRKFVGMYDLGVGVVSTTFSLIFGVGLERDIKKGYKKILKPLSDSPNAVIRSRAGAAIVGLAAFSSFFLQTIIGKRIVAPAIGVPAGGKLRKLMEDRENAKKSKNNKMSAFPAEALVLAKNSDKTRDVSDKKYKALSSVKA